MWAPGGSPAADYGTQARLFICRPDDGSSAAAATVARVPPTDVGEEPDPRFTLANERTFLAWNRTALALIGGGVAIGQLLDFSSQVARLVCALTPMVLGVLLAVASLQRWRAVQHAMRTGAPLPQPSTVRLLAVGVSALAVVAGAAVLADALAR